MLRSDFEDLLRFVRSRASIIHLLYSQMRLLSIGSKFSLMFLLVIIQIYIIHITARIDSLGRCKRNCFSVNICQSRISYLFWVGLYLFIFPRYAKISELQTHNLILSKKLVNYNDTGIVEQNKSSLTFNCEEYSIRTFTFCLLFCAL